MPPVLLDVRATEVESGVSMFTGEPFVVFRHQATDDHGVITHVMRGQLDPPAAEELAIVLARAAESARHDAALFAELTAAGLPDHVKGTIIDGVRSRRLDMSEDE